MSARMPIAPLSDMAEMVSVIRPLLSQVSCLLLAGAGVPSGWRMARMGEMD